jgi:hypothetical protein
MDPSKFILKSQAIWGAIIVGATAILPVVTSAIGYPISISDITLFGDAVSGGLKAIGPAFDALGSIIGAFMILRGRLNATAPLHIFAPK